MERLALGSGAPPAAVYGIAGSVAPSGGVGDGRSEAPPVNDARNARQEARRRGGEEAGQRARSGRLHAVPAASSSAVRECAKRPQRGARQPRPTGEQTASSGGSQFPLFHSP
eukprot:13783144-Alexandrium_andersonii.AAC.1